MMGEPPAVLVVGPLTEHVEHGGEGKGNEEVIGGIRVGYQEKQGCFFISQRIEAQLVIAHNLP